MTLSGQAAGRTLASASLLPAGSVVSSAELQAKAANAAMNREVYVLAFRSGVRQGCRWGAADPIGAALASTRAVAQGVADDERPAIMAALDSASTSFARSGGCATLGGATRMVIVDNFHGARWHAPKELLFGSDGTVAENGLTVVTKSVKLGSGMFHSFGAKADYTFTTEGGLLVAGRDRVPVDERGAAARWAAVERDILARYPTLLVSRTQQADDADCTRWRTVFSNPDTQALEVTLSTTRDPEGKLWITAEYPGLAGR